MKKIILLGLLILFVCSTQAQATVVNFDDLVGQAQIPTDYAGITWAPGWEYYDWVQPPYNPSSLPTRVYSYSPDTWFQFSAPVSFQGAYFAGPGFTDVYFGGYLGGVLQETSSTISLSGTPTFLSANFGTNVDKVSIISNEPGYFVMDDVTYNSTAIPEPASMMLLGLGLAGLIARRKRDEGRRTRRIRS